MLDNDNNIIEIESLSFSYPDGSQILNDINLSISRGCCLGIIGPNGAGKTTLLLHLNGILRGKGRIHVCGFDMNDKNVKEIRKRVGLIFQDPDDQLFNPTVYDDVAFGPLNMYFPREEIPIRVTDSLKSVGMEGYETRSPQHLSFGEKKKISFATILSLLPEITVMDEPTSNLDPKSRRELINLIRCLPGTKIIATHDLELVLALCDRIVLLNDGKIIADGNPLDILSQEELLDRNRLEVPLSIKNR